MGNSITFDNNSFDNPPRPDGVRISYRFWLYQLIKDAGYSFDFTGSENAGNDFFQNAEMDDNAGFPGITTSQLAYLIKTGYNQRTKVQEAPGPYLVHHPTDIILLHIGTNGLVSGSKDVKNLLDNIRFYDNDVIILVARIINRKTYSALTTTFNDNVEAMVKARNDPRIISVDIENGSALNYSTEMIDNLHPNTEGYNKMAIKWFQAIDELNSPPVIADIPTQFTNEGIAFEGLSLDSYISDEEDVSLITWTFKQQTGSNISVTLDANRILNVAPVDMNWFGTESITLFAEDNGNGAFRKKDSINIVFTVQPINDPPVISSIPADKTYEDELFSYTILATDIDPDDVLSYAVPLKPAWLKWDPLTHTLSGTPLNDDVGITNITVSVSDGSVWVDQPFQLIVNNVNDPPEIISVPDLNVFSNQAYLYEMKATDIDNENHLSYSVSMKPSWLDFIPGSTCGILAGTCSEDNIGDWPIVLKVSDGQTEVIQEFMLTVSATTSMNEINKSLIVSVYPNPVQDYLFVKFTEKGKKNIRIYNINGKLQKQFDTEYQELLEINVTDLANGTYFIIAIKENDMYYGKFTKI